MKRIEINFKEFTGNCMLLPRYDLEANILEFTSNIRRKWEYGIDINGSIIFDIDNEYKIANCDLLIPKNTWENIEYLPINIISDNKKLVDLSFSKSTIDCKSFNVEINVFVFKEKLYILLDNPINVIKNKLSEKCDVLSFKNELRGFVLKDL